ncbi:hypothetical protein OH76DRAFT_736685 [Lentinus brumalis]|uniref:Uncharacterized protein n=1 Tax=Lentinus brumalis TaxID=2498619 RepID=A0A371DS64_9APHY|nr:hypothetical protein OH76DRAFT_736685 [Polyporus brumalis]
MGPTTDADRLAFFLSGACEYKKTASGLIHPSFEKETARAGRYLNSLARLVVHKIDEPRQVFAVAIVPPSLTQRSARLIISENLEVTKEAENHARDILHNVYAARQSIDNQFPLHIPPYIRPDCTDAVQRKLVDIETAVIRHSCFKMGKRFRKANRDIAFFEVSGTYSGCPGFDPFSVVEGELWLATGRQVY